MEKSIDKQNLSKLAVKNSYYNFAASIILKLGGLVFTIIIARLLLPELFGIYALAMSIVTIFMIFTDFGVNETFLRYFSESLGEKNKKKARRFFQYLIKIKFILVFFAILFILILSKFLSYNLYEKPGLFYPLIFSSLFILMESFKGFFATIFLATKNLKPIPFLELLHQIIKISFSVFAVLIFSTNFKISGLILAFSLAGFIHLIFLFLIPYKKDKSLFVGEKEEIDKRKVKKFLGFMSLASLSLVFFGSIDTLMLGKFVDAEYIAYYRVALSLVLTISGAFSLSGVLLPIFTQINKKRFVRGFQKTFKYLVIFALPATIGILFVGKHLIFIIYGREYLLAASSLYFLSLLILTAPLTNLFETIFKSKEGAKILAKSVLISLLINIFLNYILIKYLLNFSQEHAIIGVSIATVFSRIIYFGILLINAKKFNLPLRGLGIRRPFFATLIMGLFLLFFNKFIDINILTGIIEIIFGIGIYLGTMFLIKGITKEDLNIAKSLFKR